MAILTFWNNNTGKIGQSYSALAIATLMAIEHKYKILLISTKYDDNVNAQAFGFHQLSKALNGLIENKNTMELESGIESLSKLALSNRLIPDIVPNYTRMILRERLEILSGPTNHGDEDFDYSRIYESCKKILKIANKYYDMIFIDLNNGIDETTMEILKMSDIVIYNIEQKISEIEKIKELKKSILPANRTMLLMNRYDRECKYSTKNATRYLEERREMMSVPYNHLYAEAVQEGTGAEFFLNPKLRKLQDVEDKNAFFVAELKRACDAIIYSMQELQIKF